MTTLNRENMGSLDSSWLLKEVLLGSISERKSLLYRYKPLKVKIFKASPRGINWRNFTFSVEVTKFPKPTATHSCLSWNEEAAGRVGTTQKGFLFLFFWKRFSAHSTTVSPRDTHQHEHTCTAQLSLSLLLSLPVLKSSYRFVSLSQDTWIDIREIMQLFKENSFN